MTITINGQQQSIPDSETVASLVDRLGLKGSACAVEVNKRLVPRREHESQPLREGDSVEVVTLVGGG